MNTPLTLKCVVCGTEVQKDSMPTMLTKQMKTDSRGLEYEANPDVVRTRIYSAKTVRFMEKLKKIYVVQDGDSKIFIDP